VLISTSRSVFDAADISVVLAAPGRTYVDTFEEPEGLVVVSCAPLVGPLMRPPTLTCPYVSRLALSRSWWRWGLRGSRGVAEVSVAPSRTSNLALLEYVVPITMGRRWSWRGSDARAPVTRLTFGGYSWATGRVAPLTKSRCGD